MLLILFGARIVKSVSFEVFYTVLSFFLVVGQSVARQLHFAVIKMIEINLEITQYFQILHYNRPR